MYRQLHGYEDLRCLDLSSGSDLSVISKRIYDGFAKPYRLTLKHPLFLTHTPKKLPKAIGEIPLGDKADVFKLEE